MQTMTPKQRRESIKLANAVWKRLNYCLNNQTYNQFGDRLFKLATADEKRHRGFDSGGYPVSIADASRHIMVATFAKLLTFHQGNRMPKLKDFIKLREDWYLTASLIANYRKEIMACFKDKVELQACAELDYAALMATPDEQPALVAA